MGPAILFSFFGLVGLVAALLTKETNGRARRAENTEAELIATGAIRTAAARA